MLRAGAVVVGFVAAMAGCYEPSYPAGAPCSSAGTCPGLLRCVDTVCRDPHDLTTADAAGDARDPDAPLIDDDAPDSAADAALVLDAPPDAPPVVLGPWGAPVAVAGVNLGSEEADPTLSADELEIVFAEGASISLYDLYTATRPDRFAAFSTPVRVPVSAGGQDSGPALSADALDLYFTRNNNNANDIAVSHRASRSAAFMTATVVPALSGATDDLNTALVDNDLTAYVDHIVVASDSEVTQFHRSTLAAPWTVQRAVTELTSPALDGSITVDGTGTYAVFHTQRSGNLDLWAGDRDPQTGVLTNLHRLDELDTATLSEQDPHLSADGRRLYFVRSNVIVMSTRVPM